MPPSKGGKGGKERGSAIIGAKKESGLQAVVLIDSNTLSSSFAPLTSPALPTFLLPVCGAPLLEYTLEFLAMQSAVNEIVLVSSRNAKTLRDYLSQSSRWSANLEDSISAAAASSSVSDTVVIDGLNNLARPKIRIPALSLACKTSGDEIRALESTGVLRSGSTFLLLEGLIVSNANLSAAIAAHEMRAKVDPNVTLTNVLVKRNQHHQTSLRTSTHSATTTNNTNTAMAAASIITQSSLSSSPDALLKPSIGTPHFTRIEKALNRLHVAGGQSLNEICIMTLDSADGRIWSYALNPGSSHSDSISTAPVQRPEGASKDIAARLSRRSFLDVAETGIYICSPQVAIHFSDNYDYSSLRNHYIKNEVANIDMGWRFNVHIVSSCYAMQASRDPRSLMQANFDVAQGWCAPFTVDTIAGWPRASSASFSSYGGMSFPLINLQDTFLFAKSHASATLKATSATTSYSTTDSSSSTIVGANVVLGANCTIGEGAILDRCMLSEGCVVGPGAVIRDSILLSSVVIEANARVTGAILGQGVVIKSKANVLSGAVLGGSVVIGEGHTVPLGARVTVAQRPSSVFQANDVLIVGAGGQGRAWPDTKQERGEGEEEEEEEEDNAITIGEAGLISAATSVALVSKRINELLKEEMEKTQGEGQSDVSLSDLADAVRAAFKFKNLLTAPGLKNTIELGLCLVWGASSKELQRSTTLSSLASSSSFTTSTSSFNSNNPFVGHGASSLDPALQRFSFGVYDLFFDGGCAPLPQNSGNLSLEIKSFKYAENRSTADCLNEVVPLVFGLLKGSMSVAVLKTHVSAWAPLLARFVVEPEDEVACISSLSKFICRPALRSLNNNVPAASAAADPRLMFGVIVNFLFDPEVAIVEGLVDDEGNERGVLTAEGIRAWSSRAWQAAGGDDDDDEDDGNSEIKNRENSEISASSSSLPDVSDLNVLLESKYWGLLQDRLDEEEEEEEEEEGE